MLERLHEVRRFSARCLWKRGKPPLCSRARHAAFFGATALPAIEKRLRVDLPSDIDKYRPVTCSLEFFFDKDKTSVTMRAQAVYGAIRYDLVGELTDRPEPVDVPLPVRDVKREAKARSLAARYFGAGTSLALSDGDAVGALLFGGLVEFREAGTVFTTPRSIVLFAT